MRTVYTHAMETDQVKRIITEKQPEKPMLSIKAPLSGLFSNMQEMGLEPTHCCQRQILSLMRLPFRHSCLFTISGCPPILSSFQSNDQIEYYHIRLSFSSVLSNFPLLKLKVSYYSRLTAHLLHSEALI